MNPENDDRVSLNKVVSGSGFCSRREADKYIETGRVTINNRTARKGDWVKQGDVVAVDGEKIKSPKKNAAVYIAFNKPVGIASTTDTSDKTNIIDYINYSKRIFPVGRLDKDSDGLIFLTNDGDIVNKILRASNNHEKEYIVTVDKPVDEAFVRKMSGGIPVLDEVTKKCYVRADGARRFRIILTQGLNRQIRRMCEHLGYKVHTLTRVRIMNISLGNLGVGQWRYFTAAEIEKMNEIIADSSKTDEGTSKIKTQNVKVKSQKLKKEEEPEVVEYDDEEPTRPFHEYEEVRQAKKKTGNQWWADNKKKPKKEKPALEPFPERKRHTKTREPHKNKKAAVPVKGFTRNEKSAGKKVATAKGRGGVAKPFNRKEQKPTKGRR
jgi:23S rRNA pseudouridine2604 synthase